MTDDEPLQSEESDDEIEALAKKIAPALRNATVVGKVLRRVCYAGADLVVAGLEAGTSRLLLTKVRNEALIAEASRTKAMEVGARVGKRLLEEQERVDEIVIDAINRLPVEPEQEPDLSETTIDGTHRKEIEDDWLEVFRREATGRSLGEMREAFVRILAGEMQAPGTFSIKAVRTLGLLDRSAAELFRRAASLQVSMEVGAPDPHVVDARIPSLGGNLGENSLQEEGLSYVQLLDLIEHDLIYPELNSWADYQFSIRQPGRPIMPLVHQGQKWILVPMPEFQLGGRFKITGVGFTRVGKELLRLVDIEQKPRLS